MTTATADWQKTKIKDMEISDGLVNTMATTHKLKTAGDLEAAWQANRLEAIKTKHGKSAFELVVGELRRISGGDGGKETAEAPATVKFEQPNGQATEKANGTSHPVGEAGGEGPAPALPAETPPIEGATITVSAAEWTRLNKLDGRVRSVEEKSAHVQELKQKYSKLKDSSLAAKKTYDEATNELLDMIAGQLRIDFDAEPEKAKPAKEEKATSSKGQKKGDEVLEKLRSQPDAWRAAPLTVLPTVAGDKRMAKRLGTIGLKTIGDLQDVRAKNAWPEKTKQETKDKLCAEADEWLTKNRDAGVFAGAKAEATEREREFPKQVELTKDIEHGGKVVFKAGTVVDTTKATNGGVGIDLGGAAGHVILALEPDQWRPAVKMISRASTIQLTKDIPGFATEEDQCNAGAEFEVVGWSGDCPLIKTPADRETSVAPGEFVVLESKEWPVEE